jgi:hypothetical protein
VPARCVYVGSAPICDRDRPKQAHLIPYFTHATQVRSNAYNVIIIIGRNGGSEARTDTNKRKKSNVVAIFRLYY